MTNQRETLIELLETMPHPHRLYPDLYVDHLIENGVEIPVRCKDCDFRAFDDACQEYYCDCVNGINGAITDNAFCSYGERKSYE